MSTIITLIATGNRNSDSTHKAKCNASIIPETIIRAWSLVLFNALIKVYLPLLSVMDEINNIMEDITVRHKAITGLGALASLANIDAHGILNPAIVNAKYGFTDFFDNENPHIHMKH